MAAAKEWAKVGDSKTSPNTAVQRKEVRASSPKTENIIFIGSEMSYDSFWWKMMFIDSAYLVASKGQLLRCAHRKTIAFVDDGYTKFEKLPLELLKGLGYQVVALNGTDDLVACFCKDRDQYKLQDVAFFSHGVIGQIALNYKESTDVTLSHATLAQVPSDVFVADGRIFSYACRTGTGVEDFKFGFKNIAETKPEISLAQKMADHFGVLVFAYMRRTFFRDVLRKPGSSNQISSLMRLWRQDHDGELAPLPPDHEGLPHPGLADSWMPMTGPKREWTDNYALWPKHGGFSLPIAHETPAGVPPEMRTYSPSK